MISQVKGENTNLRHDFWFFLDSDDFHGVWGYMKCHIWLLNASLMNLNGPQIGNIFIRSGNDTTSIGQKVINNFNSLIAAITYVSVSYSSYLMMRKLSIYWIMLDHVWINTFLWNIWSLIFSLWDHLHVLHLSERQVSTCALGLCICVHLSNINRNLQ